MSLLAGCAAYTNALYGEGPASEDYIHCKKDNAGYETIPDFGTTWRQHFQKCMTAVGWQRLPGPQPEGPAAYRRIGDQQTGETVSKEDRVAYGLANRTSKSANRFSARLICQTSLSRRPRTSIGLASSAR